MKRRWMVENTGKIFNITRALRCHIATPTLTLWVSPMEDGKGDRAMDLMLRGDDHGVEQATLGSIIEGVSQGNSGTEMNSLHLESNGPSLAADQLRVVPVGGKVEEDHSIYMVNLQRDIA